MKYNRNKRKYPAIANEQQLVDFLNNIRSDENILDLKGFFTLNELKQLATSNQYTFFKIPKKRGGHRQICTPARNLAFVQLCIAILMKGLYKPNSNVFGFVEGKSIVDNAKIHIGKKYVLNIDLKDFFNSITEDVIIEKLIRQPYYFSYKASKFISDLVTVIMPNGVRCLPQGSPSSPIITNIVADHLDVRLSKLAQKYNVQYSRYADDITFSSVNPVLFKRKGLTSKKKGLRGLIEFIIQEEGFEINNKKSRISLPSQQHEVTGLVVNDKVNVRRNYVKHLRTEIHNWEKDGYIKASFIFFKHHDSTYKRAGIASMENVIDGKLSFLRMVKGENDPTYLKLKIRYESLLARDKRIIELANLNEHSESNDNVFEIKYPKNKLLKRKNKDNEYNHWEVVGTRNFSDKECELIISGTIIPSNYGNSACFQLTNGKIKFIPVSYSSSLGVGDKVDVTRHYLQILSNGFRRIYRIV